MGTSVKVITANGDTRNWVVEIKNESNFICYNAQFAFTIPEGISLIGPAIEGTTSITVPVGVYNPTSKIWYLGNLGPNAIIEANFIFRVDDIEEVDTVNNWFEIKGTISSSCIEIDDCDNIIHLLLSVGTDCAPLDLSAGPEDDPCCENEVDVGIV